MTVYIFPPVTIPAPVGGATEAKQDTQITAAGSTNTKLDTLIAKDFATNTALIAVGNLVALTATAAKQDTTNTKLDSLIAKDYATQTTLALLRKWPYATHNTIEPSEDVTNTYYTYKTSGAVTVGTITTNKSTGVITYSPNKIT